ncbi:Protein kinase-like domain protein [Metarhizium guizhouense ARSEF 977]|uniref:non-specific serine/threonine protein kinase n=1 Tax=Metarhizium guizhouense (strain ARSEF 977) TaxID=1276136 RepID=A0A0B4GR39_METGA|nr:Protein kinase-like domain protein [Metarhizium guizhouense ARSEF 977]
MVLNVNQGGFQRRLAVVEQILQSHDLQASNISTLAYSEEYLYPFNNYLFKVELATPALSSSFPGTQPGTTQAPSDGISVIVIKLSNPAATGINNTNRVENDVAVQHLVRQSMAHAGLPQLVPAIYAWMPTTITNAVNETSFGWIISELRSGVDLDSEFSSLEMQDKEQILEQMANVLKAIQTAELPEGATKFGGVTFDSEGRIVSGQAPLRKGEPVKSYAEWRVSKLHGQLQEAAQSPVIQGWKHNGVDARIEKFLAADSPEKILSNVDLHQKNLIHGDFTTNNMLFDKDTKKLTAVLDFDWSYISNPLDEFMGSLQDIGGNIRHEDKKIEAAILSGDFTWPPPNIDKESVEQWQVAKAWNTAMKKCGVVSPSDIRGVDEIRDLLHLQALLCPYQLGNESMLKQFDEKKRAEMRAKTEAELIQWLEKHGF